VRVPFIYYISLLLLVVLQLQHVASFNKKSAQGVLMKNTIQIYYMLSQYVIIVINVFIIVLLLF